MKKVCWVLCYVDWLQFLVLFVLLSKNSSPPFELSCKQQRAWNFCYCTCGRGLIQSQLRLVSNGAQPWRAYLSRLRYDCGTFQTSNLIRSNNQMLSCHTTVVRPVFKRRTTAVFQKSSLIWSIELDTVLKRALLFMSRFDRFFVCYPMKANLLKPTWFVVTGIKCCLSLKFLLAMKAPWNFLAGHSVLNY